MVKKDHNTCKNVPPAAASQDVAHHSPRHRKPLNTLYTMTPSDQMTYLLQLIKDGYEPDTIDRMFYGDQQLVKLLKTSLEAFGFLDKNVGELYITEKGKSKLSRHESHALTFSNGFATSPAELVGS